MPEDQTNGDQNHAPEGPLSEVPHSTPGWMTHIPTLHPDHFPRAPIPFAYGTNLFPRQNGQAVHPPLSSTFNEHRQQFHPTYAPTLAFGQYDQEFSTSLPHQSPLQSSLQQPTTALPSRSHVPSLPEIPYVQSSLHPPPWIASEILPRPSSFSPGPNNHIYGYNAFPSWQSTVRDSRLPPVPQDVEYPPSQIHFHEATQPTPQSYAFQKTGLETASTTDLLFSSHDDRGKIDPKSKNGPPTDAPLGEFHENRKRTRGDAGMDENDAFDQRQASKPKRPRKSRAQGMAGDGQQIDSAQTEDVTLADKAQKGRRSRGRPKGQKVGPRPTLDPGPQFMNLYNQAMDAFIEENDLITAQTRVLEAIAVNPEIFAAHNLLSDIHFANGNHEKALDALMGGLHAHMNDVELWRQVADTILADTHESSQKRLERAMYCFGGVLRKDPKDMDARFQRAECARLLGQVNRAFSDLNILLQDDPHNSLVLAHFAKLCYDVDDVSKAKLLYDDHFQYYKTKGISSEDSFTWQDIGVYTDLMVQIGEIAQAIVMLKRLSRWLCGRLEEDFWEEYLEDDREFDQTHYPRRLEVAQFEPDAFPERDYGEALPLDIRAKLGILRLKLNYHQEAQSHFDWLEPDIDDDTSIVEEYSDTFLEVAKALLDAKEYKDALRFYDALEEAGIELGFDFWVGLGASAYVCDDKQKAIRAYEQALKVNSGSIEARTQLAKLYRDLEDRPNALKYGREAVLLSQDAIPQTGNRKYESKENRLLREAAERALKGAYRLPMGPRGVPGKVPDSLKYRTRYRSKFKRYVPRQTEELEDQSVADDEGAPQSGKEKIKRRGPQKKGKSAKTSAGVPFEDSGEHLETERERQSNGPGDASGQVRSGSKGQVSRRKPYRKQPSKIDSYKHYEDVQALYRDLLAYQSSMRNGDEEATSQWMDCAQALVDDFRTVKIFFPGERHKKFEGYTTVTALPRPTDAPEAANDGSDSCQSAQPPVAGLPTSGISPKPPTTDRIVDGVVPNEYCGISFSTWLDIFLELALVTANSPTFRSNERDLQSDCYSIINAAIDCNVFYHHQPSLIQIYTVYLSCCLALNDDVTLYNTVLRWFMNEFAFCTDTYRLYSAVALIGEYGNLQGKSRVEGSMYRDSSNQKFLFRQLCSIDQQLPKNYGVGTEHGPVPGFMRRKREGLRKQMGDQDDGKDASNEPVQSPNVQMARENTFASTDNLAPQAFLPRRDRLGNPIGVKSFSPKEMDAVLFILYSHLMMANNSFTNALVYLYRAYSLDPSNTVCLLSMAFCYLTELFKRQVGNRHAFSLMGWAWFGRYETERRKWATQIDEQNNAAEGDGENGTRTSTSTSTSDGKVKMLDIVNREIEFNRARCWEMLGMADLAVRGYKKMLSLPNPNPRENSKQPGNGTDNENGDDDDDGPESWDMEAAYALSSMYMINGDGAAAREIAEKYMVVE